ncbi:MAG: hypothetical protein U0U66_00570 [Cytophagaceae bacterium]
MERGFEVTEEQIRNQKGLEHLKDWEIKEAKQTIEKLSALLVKMLKDEMAKQNSKQQSL